MMTVTTTHCGTCGNVHNVSPFGECPRWAEPLFDTLTRAELDTLTGKLTDAAIETEAEANALARMNRRTHYNWSPSFSAVLFGVEPAAYTALATDIAWLLSEALGALEVRA